MWETRQWNGKVTTRLWRRLCEGARCKPLLFHSFSITLATSGHILALNISKMAVIYHFILQTNLLIIVPNYEEWLWSETGISTILYSETGHLTICLFACSVKGEMIKIEQSKKNCWISADFRVSFPLKVFSFVPLLATDSKVWKRPVDCITVYITKAICYITCTFSFHLGVMNEQNVNTLPFFVLSDCYWLRCLAGNSLKVNNVFTTNRVTIRLKE